MEWIHNLVVMEKKDKSFDSPCVVKYHILFTVDSINLFTKVSINTNI